MFWIFISKSLYENFTDLPSQPGKNWQNAQILLYIHYDVNFYYVYNQI